MLLLSFEDIKIMQDYCVWFVWCLRDISIQFMAQKSSLQPSCGTPGPVSQPHKHIQMVAVSLMVWVWAKLFGRLWIQLGWSVVCRCLACNVYLHQEVCDMRSDEWFPRDRVYKQRLYASRLFERPWGQKPTGEDNSTQSRHCMANLLMSCMLRGKTLGDSEMKEGS